MKKEFIIAIAAISVGLLSCAKESERIDDLKEEENLTEENTIIQPRIITISASIDMPQAVKATLNDHAVQWSAGDYIGIATELASTVTGYTVTPGVDPTTCSFDILEVTGAEYYYAIYTGSSDFSGITFNTETKTFSGTDAGNLMIKYSRYDSPSITHKEQLSMAGKTSAHDASISMKPCLALAKLQFGSKSVANKYADSYSGVRGFNFYQDPNASWGGGAPYSSGDYSVCLSGENLVVSPLETANRKNFREISESELLDANTPYYIAFIPGGDINGFKIDLVGFDSDSNISYDAQYTLKLQQSMTIDPGDYFDFGVIDPVGAKKDEASFSDYAISIDGVFSDWASVTTSGGPNNGYTECKVTYDNYYIYFYSKTTGNSWNSSNYIYYCLDTDNNNTTGGDLWGHAGFESIFYISPYSATEGVFNASPSIHRSYPSSVSATASCAGSYDAVNGVVELEVKVSRKAALVFKGDELRIWSYASGDKSGYFNLGSTLSITK